MSYYHITIEERACIYQFLNMGMSLREIARALHRSPSTISREVKRNSTETGSITRFFKYYPKAAHKKYLLRRTRCSRRRKYDTDAVRYVQDKLYSHWSPEQIANRKTNDLSNVPSTSTIYRYIHAHLIGSISMANLRRKGHFKRPAETRGRFNDGGRRISKRPKEVYKRKEIGHWEGDTVESGRNDHKRKSKYCFVTLCERVSRKYIAVLVPSKASEYVTEAIIDTLKVFPPNQVKTITFDRGKEFSGYEKIEEALGCRTYFCDPYCAWQKGSNENSNGLLREFYPKGMDLSTVDNLDLQHNLDMMNNRPRKCLKYKTPNEVFYE